MTAIIRIQPKDAPNFMASKWLHYDVLVDDTKIRHLLEHFGSGFYLFSTLGVAPRGEHELKIDDFVNQWKGYIDALKAGNVPNDQDNRFYCTAALTKTLSALRALDVGNDREIIIAYEPLIQMQLHRFNYSQADHKFHSMSFGQKSISWGVRLSYPQLYQNPQTRVVVDATDENLFVNATLFQELKSWIRANTQPTPFLIDGKRVNDPMRIGKECFSWINNHAQLKENGLFVAG